ncbi:uncharacterized protein LOC132745820 [Ruditapes philippinarum]|uniref:uncharacterized protein LOC132745820 n=1 Tax=Ruditapes philippinarum TaxID=129788 RepID=UPI00295A5E4D|nr:uncharacterized protein LOC132745820 [Ruditapes philippinarum]
MCSSVSGTGNTKVTETELQKQEKSERNIEEYTEIAQSPSHCLESVTIAASTSKGIESPPPDDHFEAPPTNDIITPSPAHSITMSNLNKQQEIGDDKNTEIDKSTDKEDAGVGGKKVENEWMTDKELEEFRQETFDDLRETAEAVVALLTRHQKGGAFVDEIYDAALVFDEAYYELEKTSRENIIKFRKDIAELMIETKYFKLSCEIVMHTYMNGWRSEEGNEEESKTVPLIRSLDTLCNFSDCCDEYAIGLANEPGFLDTLIQVLRESLPKYFAKEGEPKLVGIEKHLIEPSLTIVHNMSMRETNILNLRNAGILSCLKPYLKSPNTKYALTALASLAGVINEEESNVIKSNKDIVMILLDCIREGMKDKMRECRGWSCQESVFSKFFIKSR